MPPTVDEIIANWKKWGLASHLGCPTKEAIGLLVAEIERLQERVDSVEWLTDYLPVRIDEDGVSGENLDGTPQDASWYTVTYGDKRTDSGHAIGDTLWDALAKARAQEQPGD